MNGARVARAAAIVALVMGAGSARAQFGGGGAIPAAKDLIKITVAPLKVTPGQHAEITVLLEVKDGWHVNANPAANEDAIPTEITIAPQPGFTAGPASYPPPKILKLSFDPQRQMVYDARTAIPLGLVIADNAPGGTRILKGKLRFQSCNDQVCLPPETVSFDVPVEVAAAGAPASGGTPAPNALSAGETRAPPESTASGAAPSGTPPAPAAAGSFTTAPPAGGARPASLDNPVARAIEGGGVGAFLALFLFGLALNLTPCVYPMLGVTVSIFGARRAAPPAQVIGYAALYVLGMALMYTTLGVVAALTGGLFGGFLQSPWVLAGIGALLVIMALSMFGLFEIAAPPELMQKLGGTTASSAAGVFLSGVVVGVFAAPCVGPAVVALLAVVGAKGDPWLGFTTFFSLSLGLGFPYLLLATFSNLIQKMPRSGEWMVWVKAVFGVILAGVGAFYLLLALAPRQAGWVMPVALVLGGLYLGFVEKTRGRGPNFVWMKRGVGVAAAALGVWLVATTPTGSVTFRPASDEALKAAMASGKPVLLEFSADWCVPCHELERATFSDRAVIGATRDFHAFKVDLTRYDSPESERWRRTWGVKGVPTVIFFAPGGGEIRELRVEGFTTPAAFLERLRLAARGATAAAQ